MATKAMKLAQAYRKQHSPNKQTARAAKAVIKAYKRERRLKGAAQLNQKDTLMKVRVSFFGVALFGLTIELTTRMR